MFHSYGSLPEGNLLFDHQTWGFKAQTHLKKICGKGTSSKQKWIVGPQMDWHDWSLVPNPVLFKVSN